MIGLLIILQAISFYQRVDSRCSAHDTYHDLKGLSSSGSLSLKTYGEDGSPTISCGRNDGQITDCRWFHLNSNGWTQKHGDKTRKINYSNHWCNLTFNSLSSEDRGAWRCTLLNDRTHHFQEGFFDVGGDKKKLDIRLPSAVVPEHYTIHLHPNIVPEDFTFKGSVVVKVNVLEKTNNITLHIRDLQIDEDRTVIEAMSGATTKISGHGYDTDREFYIIYTAETLESGDYELTIKFTGYLNNELSGFYRSSYVDSDGNTKWLATTQFETTSARRAFPCFDEPAMKAVFQINLARPRRMSSISNMPLSRTSDFGETDVLDEFQESLRMSTYLVAFVISDFVYRESVDESNGVVFRIWSRPDLYDQTAYAAEVGPKILRYYEEYFNTPFPLPKQDMIAIPDFGAGAMENWGLVTYREYALLYEEGVNSISEKEYVAIVIAHELGHQWFGDLVTMKWWTDLWLNEGFASYTEYIGTNHVEPETAILERFILDSVQPALSLDALESSHPISIPVNHPDEINEIFDTISYKKGASVIRMMSNFLEIQTFTKGITNYLNTNAFGNAEQDDLWRFLREAAQEDGTLSKDLTVKEIMDTWTLQTGYPVVQVARDYTTKNVVFTQSRFLINPNSSSNDEFTWYIPISYAVPSTNLHFNDTSTKVWMMPKDVVTMVRVEEALTNLPLIVNVIQSGFYRVNYDPENWRLIAQFLETPDFQMIHRMNRAQILNDALNLARAGLLDYTTALSTTSYLAKENDFIPWSSALDGFDYLDNMLKRSPGYGEFRHYMIRSLQHLYDELTFYEKPEDSILDINLREKIILWMCSLGEEECTQLSLDLFNQWMASESPDEENPIPSFSREIVLCTALEKGSEEEWDFLFNRFIKSNNANEKNAIIRALGCIKEDWILERYLGMALDESSGIKRQDGTGVITAVAKNTIGRYITWNWLRNNWSKIRQLYDTGIISFTSRMIQGVAESFNTEADLRELELFIRNQEDNLGTAEMACKQMVEKTRVNINWMSTHYETIVDWLKAN